MSIKSIAILVALVAITAFSPTSAAGSAEGRYDVASTPVVSVQSNSFLGLALGGYNFGVVDGVPTSVVIADESGGAVSYTVCQDTNADSLCGQPGEATMVGCGTEVDLTESAVPFIAGAATLVFVKMVDASCGAATSGTITLNFE